MIFKRRGEFADHWVISNERILSRYCKQMWFHLIKLASVDISVLIFTWLWFFKNCFYYLIIIRYWMEHCELNFNKDFPCFLFQDMIYMIRVKFHESNLITLTLLKWKIRDWYFLQKCFIVNFVFGNTREKIFFFFLINVLMRKNMTENIIFQVFISLEYGYLWTINIQYNIYLQKYLRRIYK